MYRLLVTVFCLGFLVFLSTPIHTVGQDTNSQADSLNLDSAALQLSVADILSLDSAALQLSVADSIRVADSLANIPYEGTTRPTFRVKDRFGDPFSSYQFSSPLIPKDFKGINMGVQVDTGRSYTVSEKIGGFNYRPDTKVTFEEYKKYHEAKVLKDYWRSRAQGGDGESAVDGKNLIPPIYLSPVLDRLFGGNTVDIQMNGYVQLDFGGRWQRIDNPTIPIRQQRNGGFEFDQNISTNASGTIGTKVQVEANFDNNNSFDFENTLKVDFTGGEADILKKIEIGNVSMPVQNSLISGAQNLFGLKTEMQFGKLFVTAVAATARGSSDGIELDGGSQVREFEVRGSEYDENRHFFLGQFFRDNYERWLSSMPEVVSGVNITRVEVYVINRNNNTETLRNFTGFMDLGEGTKIYRETNPLVGPGNGGPTDNGANSLFDNLANTPNIRDVQEITDILEGTFNLENSTDFETVTSARRMNDREFTFHPQLGTISLFRKLQNDEALAVSYEFTYRGQRYKVGELTEDYQNRADDDIILLKLLRPRKIAPNVPTWDLMMKNVYSLGGQQIQRDLFQLRVIYRDDDTGLDNPSLHEGRRLKDIPLVQIFNLDQLNGNLDPQPDGNFDFVEGLTIDSQKGTITFPVLEPFGNTIRSFFDPDEQALQAKYVYDTLYGTTKADAELQARNNKFYIVGQFQAGSSSEIMLPGINIAQNSVVVYAGNTPLTEGTDYTVDYNLGRVTILNEGVLASGKKIRVDYEKADLFNFQTKSLMGTRIDYRFSEDINIGLTALYMNERPLVSRINIGDEPVRNFKWGVDINYRKESRFLTKMVDALPLISTKAPSNVTFNMEFAQLLPGTSNKVQGEGTSYIDDFEASVTPFNLGGQSIAWKLASTPKTDDDRFDLSAQTPEKLGFAYRRAKMAWYIVDNVFYRTSGGTSRPSNIDPDELNNHYIRQVQPQEIFRQRALDVINVNLSIMDLAYFPEERGPYNYNPGLNNDGLLTDPQRNYAGVTRGITSEVDFDKTNVEYVEFWLMDPFINGENGRVIDGRRNENNITGGKLLINLGSISEDLIKDGLHAFENGLPADPTDTSRVRTNEWGRVTRQQFLTEAFDNDADARPNQDVGLDGLSNDLEREFFSDYLSSLSVSPQVFAQIQADPSNDDFAYYLDERYDEGEVSILERYKRFNGMEGNTPVDAAESQSGTFGTRAGTNLPENEDLNNDNTLSDLEEYYEYEIDLRPGSLEVGNKYIVDQVTNVVNGDEITWYQFRIPVRSPDRVQGNISGFKSIRYIRTYMTDWVQPVVLRMAKYQFVGSQWRRYLQNLGVDGFQEFNETYDPGFEVSVVNIEENSTGSDETSPYVVPPGIRRDRDNTSTIERRLNEQSIQLCVDDLKDGDSRAVFKNTSLDLINYGEFKMFIHADANLTRDNEMRAFVRLGTDLEQNYYQIEMPLVITNRDQLPNIGNPDDDELRRAVWPEANEMNFQFDILYKLKQMRNELGRALNIPFSDTVGNYTITVRGRPDLSDVQIMMLGLKNPKTNDQTSKEICVWFNEMRVSDFNQTAGYAANARLNAQLADFANVTASGRITTFGFGGLQQRIQPRAREETTEYDISANVTLDKLLPEKLGIKIPAYVSYEKSTVKPFFDPLDPDLKLSESVIAKGDVDDQNAYKALVVDQTVRRSLNFTNVRKIRTKPDAKVQVFDVENFAFTYAYNDITRTNVNTELYSYKSTKGAVAWNFNPEPVVIEPFRNLFKGDASIFNFLKEFNFSPIPTSMMVRGDLDRRFIKTQLRNRELTTVGILPNYEKMFTFNRNYDLRWNLTKSLSMDYNARAYAIVDEPAGDINNEIKRDSIINNIRNLGRMKNFDQSLSATYRLPFDKFGITDFVNGDVNYQTSFSWQAGAIGQADSLGNQITNARQTNLTGKFDLVKLYNKIGFLKDVNDAGKKRRPTSRNAQAVKPPTDAAADTVKAKPDLKLLKGLARVLMSVRSANFRYTLRDGTFMPGYMPGVHLLGFDQGFNGPGVGFMLGSQSLDIQQRAIEEGWLAPSSFLSKPFTQTSTIDLQIGATLEPFNNFRITLDAKKSQAADYQEQFRFDDTLNDFGSFNPSRAGSYTISFNAMKTHFIKDNDDDSSPVFADFENYRNIIKARLDAANPAGEYNLNSQDVLIPAFLAAYTGGAAESQKFSPFPKIPIPSWRVDYAGLSKLPMFSEIFTNFTISHAYQSSYSINSFNSSLLYDDDLSLNNSLLDVYPLATELNDDGDLVPIYVMNTITLTERFAPLVGVNFKTRSRMDFRIDYQRRRDLALNLSNSQVTELTSKDINFEYGFVKKGMRLPLKMRGKTVVLANDVQFKMGITLRDTKTVQRKIDDIATVTNGNINFQLRPTLSYQVKDNLQLTMYFERNVNDPRVSNSYRRATTAFGTQIRFSLQQ